MFTAYAKLVATDVKQKTIINDKQTNAQTYTNNLNKLYIKQT